MKETAACEIICQKNLWGAHGKSVPEILYIEDEVIIFSGPDVG